MSSDSVSRRAVLRGAGAVALLPFLSDEGLLAFAEIQKSPAPAKLKVLSQSQFAALESLAEGIIPADERSKGAREARVAEYVDLLLGEAEDDVRQGWLTGLAATDAFATERFGSPVARLDAAQIESLLAAMSRNEGDPKTPLESFFTTTKNATIRGYYSSRIGIHDELRYLGNQVIGEFVGCETEDGKDCPHCGQKVVS